MSTKKWIEVSETYLMSRPDEPPAAYLFLNHCSYRGDTTTPTLRRRVGVQTIRGETKRDVKDQVIAFLQRRNVRLLRPGLESNDFQKLPSVVRRPSQAIVRGTASIYQKI